MLSAMCYISSAVCCVLSACAVYRTSDYFVVVSSILYIFGGDRDNLPLTTMLYDSQH